MRLQSAQDRLQSPRVSGGMSLQGSPVNRPSGELRLHPVFLKLNQVGTLINSAVHGRKPQGSVPEPILITSSGIVIFGVMEWHAAVSDGRQAVNCTEYQLSDDEALQLILRLQQSRGTWNSFIRIQLALQQEPCLQAKAHANQVAGGKDKGLANLPEAKQIDVRQEIAYLAGACPRNISKVKTILRKAHFRLIEACQTGIVTIHRALQLCRLDMAEQIEQLSRYFNERSRGKTTRQAINVLRMEKMAPEPGVLLRALLQRETQTPGSIVIKAGTRKRTLILVGRDYWAELTSSMETTRHEI
ncbi:MAG TPA: hypothetical protein VGQ12_15850 [Candidatus Angelobacter sp.]|jgi:hypothetical protein|nr:hypothetical protein [Candidatus Angelobacter sp.]